MSETPIHIWLVENNPCDVYLFQEALRRGALNSDLRVIADGAAALALIGLTSTRRGPLPDLVLLDLSLPEVDGIEVLQAMRKSKDFSHVPVVVTSSTISPRDRASLKRLRVARYFIKPTDLDAFFQIAPVLKEVLSGGIKDVRQLPSCGETCYSDLKETLCPSKRKPTSF